jgi:hypothetical protein
MMQLVLETCVGLLALCIGGVVLVVALIGIPVAAAGAVVTAFRRTLTPRRSGSKMHWSQAPDEVARMVVGEQATSFEVRFSAGLRPRRLTFVLMPLRDGPAIPGTSTGPGTWQVFCPQSGGGLITQLPWSGHDLARDLKLHDPDLTVGQEALNQVMTTMIQLVWTDGRSAP